MPANSGSDLGVDRVPYMPGEARYDEAINARCVDGQH